MYSFTYVIFSSLYISQLITNTSFCCPALMLVSLAISKALSDMEADGVSSVTMLVAVAVAAKLSVRICSTVAKDVVT